ncbi:MAG: type III pantothenate kinase [Bacteroidales bacterium]|nr:type III pantothenate kinase [Bacteroidales bacterium]
MQNLILDFGNTLYKLAVFDNGDLIYKSSGEKLYEKDVIALKKLFPKIKKAIYATVVDLDKDFKNCMHSEFQTIELDHNTPIPIKNKYKTPETLGKDRLAAAVGAAKLYPQKDVLIIDAGSTITYEMLRSDGIYLGGSISPGIKMRFKSLHHFTDKLPLVTFSNSNILTGQNTEDAILSGVINGILSEVDGIINRYKEMYSNILVVFTGGDLKYFDKNLKNNIFAAENLVLQGLNFILEYNDNKTY